MAVKRFTESSILDDKKYTSLLAGNPSYVPSSYESIATYTATGSETSFTFSSIPSTYASLQIRGLARNNSGAAGVNGLRVRFNGDTTASYTYHYLEGNGSAASAAGSTAETGIYLNYGLGSTALASTFSPIIFDVLDYASSTKNKTLRAFGGNDTNTASTSYPVSLYSGLWTKTNAVTSLTIKPNSAVTFIAGTTFALYGIKG